MSRYIDVGKVLNILCDNCKNVKAVCPHYPCEQYTKIEGMPTADVRENVKSEWIEKYEPPFDVLAKGQSKYVCSNCGWRTHNIPTEGKLVGGYGAEATGAEWVHTKYEDVFYNFCPVCGAEMKL